MTDSFLIYVLLVEDECGLKYQPTFVVFDYKYQYSICASREWRAIDSSSTSARSVVRREGEVVGRASVLAYLGLVEASSSFLAIATSLIAHIVARKLSGTCVNVSGGRNGC